jgi:hypothetical protein
MAVNDQYLPGQAPFGMGGAIANTGAPGTEGISAATTAGAEVGHPTVTDPGSSSQAPQPTVTVLAGDTCSLSSDSPVPAGGDPLSGIPLSDIASMGPYPAWREPYPHPGAGGRA